MLFNARVNNMSEQKSNFPQLKSVSRIARIPVIETSWQYASGMYLRIKGSNKLIAWGLGTAESSVNAALEHTLPIVNALEGPIGLVDTLLCKSLDLVEERVPVVTFPPELIYVSTKDYVNSTIVKPVLKRADSVKQFGLDQATHVLDNKYAEFAANQLDNALDLADKYVDQYLPDPAEKEDQPAANDVSSSKAVQTIHHVDRFSRKLQRRLTQRTLLEAKAFKQGGEDSLQNLLYIADMLARDPKAVYDMAKALWASLSKDEPENQTPPANLEQLTVMVARETARRVVHLVNYTRSGITSLPQTMSIKVHTLLMHSSQVTDSLLKAIHFEEAKFVTISQAKTQVAKIQALLEEIHSYTLQFIERIAGTVASKPESKKAIQSSQNGTNAQLENNHLSSID